MTPALPASRLARGLGPLGLVGSLVLHGVVLAALVQVPGVRPSPTASPPLLLKVALLPSPAPERAAEPTLADAPTPMLKEAPAPEVPRPALAPPPLPARAKPAPRPVKPAEPQAEPPAADAFAAPPLAAAAPDSLATALPSPPEPIQISTARFRDRAAPTYPAQALRDEIEGVVRLKLLVSPAGRVLEAKILKSSGHRPLDHAAVTAASDWTLYPAEKDGQPVPGWAEVDVPFRLVD